MVITGILHTGTAGHRAGGAFYFIGKPVRVCYTIQQSLTERQTGSMPYYSDEIIEKVRSANDIVDIVSSYVKLQKRGANYVGLCPFHNEKTPSFSVSPSRQMFYCFGCGAGGDAFSFLRQYESYTFEEALKYLAERAGITLAQSEDDPQEARTRRDENSRLLEINKKTAEFYYHTLMSERGKRALEYFTGRGLSMDTIRHFGLGYSPTSPGTVYRMLKAEGYDDELLSKSGLVTIEEKGARDKFWNRAMFPIMDINNRVIGFGGRVMGDGEPKYLNSPETRLFDKSHTLYGLNYARRSRKDYFLLCEGYMDVITLHQAGFTNAVASLGTSLTEGHAGILKRYVKKVVLTYDSDGAGIKAARRAIPILREAGISARVLNMKPYKDPDEFIKALGAAEYEKRIAEAENSFIWDLDVLRRDYDMGDPEQKTAFERELRDRLTRFEDVLERENYIKVCADRFGIDFTNLKRSVNSVGSRGYKALDVRTGAESKKKTAADDGLTAAQRLVISYMAGNPAMIPVIHGYLETDEYTDGIYRDLAGRMYSLGEGKSPASLLDAYTDDPETEKEAVRAMNSPVDLDDQNAKNAAADAILRIKSAALERRMAQAVSAKDMQDVINLQARLKGMKIRL